MTTTDVSRLILAHPNLGTTGGTALWDQITAIYKKLGDNITTRMLVALSVPNTTSVDLEHDFRVAFGQIRWDIYTIASTDPYDLTRVTSSSSPSLSQFTVVATPGLTTTKIRVTNNTGSTQSIMLVAILDPLFLSEGDVQDIDIVTTAPQDGQALVYDAASSKFKPGASGDSSYKVQSVTTPNASIKGGYLETSDGKELATYSGSGTVLASYGVDLTLNLTTILGGSPANATNYYLYIDQTTLSTVQTISDTGRKVYRVVQANFVLSTTSPESMNPNRYVPIANFLSATSGTAWSGAGSAFTTFSTKKSYNGPAWDQSTAPQDGQALVYDATQDKYKPGASGDASFKLQSVTTPNLSLKGGYIVMDDERELATYSGSGSVAASFGVDLTLNLTTIFGSTPANATTYYLYVDLLTIATTPTTLTDNGRKLYPVVQANFVLSTTTPESRDPSRYVPVGFVRSATAGNAWSGSGAAFGTMAVRRHDALTRFFAYPETYTTTITSATATNTLSHNLSGKPQTVLLTYFDGTNEFGLDLPTYLKNVTSTQLIISSLGLTFGGGQELRVYAVRIPVQPNLASASRQFVSAWQTGTGTTTFPHGLNDIEDIKGMVMEEWNVTTGKYKILPPDAVTNFDATNLNVNWTGYSPSSTLQYRFIVGGSPNPNAIPLTYGGYNKFVGFGSGSFANLSSASLSSGDSVLINRDTDETAGDLTIPANVRIDQMPGTTVRLSGAMTNGVRFTGTKGVWKNMNVKLSPTGTQARGISVEAADCWVDGWVETATAQTFTALLLVTSGGLRTKASIGVLRTLGTITALEDNQDGASSTSVWGG